MDSLVKALALKKELDTFRPLDKDQELRIMQKFRLDWNYHSNHLEGNTLTYGETKALILQGITAQGKPLKDHFEMRGHNEAVLWVEEVVKNERPLTEQFIRELHILLLKEPYQVNAITSEGEPTKKWINVGQYKKTPNHVKTVTGEIFRFATPEEAPALMHELLDWYKSEKEKDDVNPILLATEFHYKFIRIHPFDDGNGRTVRILMNFILMQFGFPPVIIRSEDKPVYLSVLQQADVDIKEPFQEFIANNLVRSLELMLKGARGEKLEEVDDIDKEIFLLKNDLIKLGQRIEKIKSRESLQEFIDNQFISIYKTFFEASTIFDDFFIGKKYNLTLHNLVWEGEASPSPFFQRIKSNIKEHHELLNIGIAYSEMKYIGFEDCAMGVNFQVEFSRNVLIIKASDYSKTLLYDEEMNEDDLRQMQHSIKESGKAQIQSFIKKKKEQIKDSP